MAKPKVKYNSVKKFSTIREMMEMAVADAGDKAAYKFRENGDVREVSFKEFRDTTIYLGTALKNMGLSNKHVAMLGENSYNWICVYLTMLQSDGVYVPVDKELTAEPMSFVLDESDAEVLFYTDTYAKFVEENKGNFPKITTFVSIDNEEDTEDTYSFKKLIEKGRELYISGDHSFENIEKPTDEMRMLVYTSGTTGVAKGVMLTEHNLVSSVYYGLHVATLYGDGLSVLPYNHTYEAVAGILVAIHLHCTLAINENLKTVLKNLQFYKPYNIYLVPAFVEVFYKRIWSNAKAGGKETALKILIKVSNGLRKIGIDLRRKLFKSVHEAFGGNLCEIVCGGAPLRKELGDFFDAIGINLLNGYGITECSPLVSVNQNDFNDCATVGIPLPCCEIKIDNADDEGIGEICVKGDIVMQGYYKQPELTAEVLSEDGWFKTGDFGMVNELGQLLITGRKKNIIILDNGKNIFPEEIENYIMGIPYVAEAVVYGIKDEVGIDTGLACQVFLSNEKLKEFGIENGKEQIKEDIDAALKILPVYKRVSKIIVVDEAFQKTTTNKIKRDKINVNL